MYLNEKGFCTLIIKSNDLVGACTQLVRRRDLSQYIRDACTEIEADLL